MLTEPSNKDKPRTQDNLHLATRRCIKMCLGAFPQFEERLDPAQIGVQFEDRVIQKEVNFRKQGDEEARTDSWADHAERQDWGSIFLLDKNVIVEALLEAREFYETKELLEDVTFVDGIKNLNKRLTEKGIRDFNLQTDFLTQEDVQNYNFLDVVDKILQSDLATTETSLTRNKLQSLFEKKCQEYEQSYSQEEKAGGRS